MSNESFDRVYLGEFRRGTDKVLNPQLDKDDLASLFNMMLKFQRNTGSEFKIEEYLDTLFIFTDIAKLYKNVLASFYKENPYLTYRIWFTQLLPQEPILKVYENCYLSRGQSRPRFDRECLPFSAIFSRPKSISFILDCD